MNNSRLKPVVEYLNVYAKEFSAGHPTLEEAQEVAYPDKKAIIRLTYDKLTGQAQAEIVG